MGAGEEGPGRDGGEGRGGEGRGKGRDGREEEIEAQVNGTCRYSTEVSDMKTLYK